MFSPPRGTMPTERRLLWAISFHHLCNDGTLMALVALLPVLKYEMNLSWYDVGLLGFGLLVTVVFQYAVGRHADANFSRYLLEVGAALMAASLALLLLVNDFTGLFTVVMLMRVGAAFYHPVGISWITRAFGGRTLDTALGIQSGVGNLGVIIALASSGYLGEMFTWKVPCLLWALLNTAAVVGGLIVIRETGATPQNRTKGERISPMVTLRKIGLLAVPIVCGGALYQVSSYFGPTSLTTRGGWSPGSADLVFAVWIGIGTITSYLYGRISAMTSRGTILKAAYLVSIVSVLLLGLVSAWYFVTPVLVLFGAFLYLTYPALFAIVTAATEEEERGTAFGIVFGFQLGGGAATVYVCGIVSQWLGGPAYSFGLVAALTAVSVVSFVIWERHKTEAGARTGEPA
jgi:FSR family fosmidomycin resistance protein-like MFS transporter